MAATTGHILAQMLGTHLIDRICVFSSRESIAGTSDRTQAQPQPNTMQLSYTELLACSFVATVSEPLYFDYVRKASALSEPLHETVDLIDLRPPATRAFGGCFLELVIAKPVEQ